jgi:hypothetical protein
MDAPPLAPPTTPGPIPDRRAGRLPVAAKTVAWLDAVFGGFVVFLMFREPDLVDAYALAFANFLPLGIGVLLRSNIARLLARIAHALTGGLLAA